LLTERSLMDPLGRLRNNSQVCFWGLTQNILYKERLKYQSWKYAEGAGVSRRRMCRSVHQHFTYISLYMILGRCHVKQWRGLRCGRVKLLVGTYVIVLSESCLRTLMSRWYHSFTRVFHPFWH
jgi:hypothetical protein